MGRAKKLRNGLTPKQDAFTKVVLKQITDKGEANLTQAALQVYNTTSDKSASVIASNNLGIISIREQIEQALSRQGLSLDVITGNLGNLANHKPEKVSGDVVLKSNVELLKLMGAYPSSKHTTVNVSFKAKLKDMKYQDLKKYVEEMRQKNDELIKEVEELDWGTTQNSL